MRIAPFAIALVMIPVIVLTAGLPLHGAITGFAVSVAFIAGTVQGGLR